MGSEYVDPDPVVEAKRQLAKATANGDTAGVKAAQAALDDLRDDGEVETAARKAPRKR